MRRTLRLYVRTMLEVGRLRLGGTVALMFLFSASEGVGIALLLPILQASGFDLGAQGAVGRYERAINSAFQAVGVRPGLLLLLMMFAALVGARTLVGRWQIVAIFSVQQNFGLLLRRRLYHAIADADWLSLSRMRSSDLTHALTAEIERAEIASCHLMNLAAGLLLCALYLAIALAVSAPMTLLALGCGAGLVALLRGRVALLRGAGADLSERTKLLYAAAVEHLQSLKAARMYGAQERNFESFSRLGGEVARSNIEISRQQAAATSLFEIGTVVILAALLYFAIQIMGVAPLAVLLLLAMFARVMPQIRMCQQLFQEFAHDLPAFETVMRLRERCEAAAEPAGAQGETIEFRDSLRMEGVRFDYRPDKPAAVHGLDLTIPEGMVVALVGPSGAGKSTIADLMTGLLTPDSGRVTVGGVTLDDRHVRAWRDQIGYVSQDTFLFHDTVRGNLLWARPGAGEAELREALRMAAAEQFVDALPQGLDTPIGDRGTSISHGERQRIALARALLRHPRLLILDEATNSLDAHNEERILSAIERLRGELTIVMIAHRIAAVRWADLIYVVEGGTVVESGGWDELCAREQGRFRTLCESQGIAPVPATPLRQARARRLA